MNSVWIYEDRRGDEDGLIVFDSEETANAWFKEHDPEGVAFVHSVITASQTAKSS